MNESKIVGGLAADLCPGPSDLLSAAEHLGEYLDENVCREDLRESTAAALDTLKRGCRIVEPVYDYDGQVAPGTGVATCLAELRVENPDHDSLVARFDSLEFCLDRAVSSADAVVAPPSSALVVYLRDAIRIATLIRGQVVK